MSAKNTTPNLPQAQLSQRAHEALACIIERLTIDAGVFFISEFERLCSIDNLSESSLARLSLHVNFVDAMTRRPARQ